MVSFIFYIHTLLSPAALSPPPSHCRGRWVTSTRSGASCPWTSCPRKGPGVPGTAFSPPWPRRPAGREVAARLCGSGWGRSWSGPVPGAGRPWRLPGAWIADAICPQWWSTGKGTGRWRQSSRCPSPARSPCAGIWRRRALAPAGTGVLASPRAEGKCQAEGRCFPGALGALLAAAGDSRVHRPLTASGGAAMATRCLRRGGGGSEGLTRPLQSHS